MSEQITLQVSSNVLNHAVGVAARARRSVESILADTLEDRYAETPVELLTDEEVVLLAAMKFSAEEQERFGDLLYENREGLLTAERREELNQMMQVYERKQLRKAEALEEAVNRGLVPLLQ
ncbi:MAG: hypothetical protein SF097_01260 [Acidobacteriota bacterium]|nr:hypothetical protein [Acidobacteriota bacterium]